MSARPSPRRPDLILLGLLLVWLLPLHAAEFDVTGAATRPADRLYVLDAHVNYHFSDTVLEALDNGVPLTLVVRVQVRHQGAWIWERSLVERSLLFTIRYLPLTAQYQVMRLPDGPKQRFVTREAAIAALGEIEALPLCNRSDLDPDERYRVRVKVSLDIEALPLPLRPEAYLLPSWKLSSGWTEWPLQP